MAHATAPCAVRVFSIASKADKTPSTAKMAANKAPMPVRLALSQFHNSGAEYVAIYGVIYPNIIF
jgi:hypothetical protein